MIQAPTQLNQYRQPIDHSERPYFFTYSLFMDEGKVEIPQYTEAGILMIARLPPEVKARCTHVIVFIHKAFGNLVPIGSMAVVPLSGSNWEFAYERTQAIEAKIDYPKQGFVVDCPDISLQFRAMPQDLENAGRRPLPGFSFTLEYREQDEIDKPSSGDIL